MKIWICGHEGMLGQHFLAHVQEKQIPFVVSDRDAVDITNLSQVLDFMQKHTISHIVNCAAYTAVEQAEKEPLTAYATNANGPKHLATAAKKSGAYLLHFSTDYVFDGKASSPYRETDFCNPLNIYGISKRAGEIKLLDTYDKSCVIRTSWLFGGKKSHFVQKVLQLLQERQELSFVDDQIGCPTYCVDLAEAALILLLRGETGLFHFANQGETSWFLFAKEIQAEALNLGWHFQCTSLKPIPSSHYPAQAKRPVYSCLDTTKIEKILKTPPRNWKEALSNDLQKISTNFSIKNEVCLR